MPPDPDPILLAILREADRIEEDALYSAKSQWERARELEWIHLLLGIPATIAAAAAGVSAIQESPWLTVILATISAICAGLLTFLDPKSSATAHHNAGNEYKTLCNNTRIFRQITAPASNNTDELREQLELFNATRNRLNAESPRPSRSAFLRARRGIEQGEAAHRIDARPPAPPAPVPPSPPPAP